MPIARSRRGGVGCACGPSLSPGGRPGNRPGRHPQLRTRKSAASPGRVSRRGFPGVTRRFDPRCRITLS
jgi:hypothetical protein